MSQAICTRKGLWDLVENNLKTRLKDGSRARFVDIVDDTRTDHVVTSSGEYQFSSQVWNLLDIYEAVLSLRDLMLRTFNLRNIRGPVGIYMDTSVLHSICALSSIAADVPFIPIHVRWSREQVVDVIQEIRPVIILWKDLAYSQYIFGADAVSNCLEFPGLTWPMESVGIDEEHDHNGNTILRFAIQRLKSANECQFDYGAPRFGIDQSLEQMLMYSEETAYFIYTSSTTSTKGVGVKCNVRGLVNRSTWMEAEYPFQTGDVLLYHTPSAFVDSIYQMLGSFLTAGDVGILAIPTGIYLHHQKSLAAMVQFEPSHVTATPSVWRLLLTAGTLFPSSTRVAISSGEVLSLHLYARMKEALPDGCAILNLYGCTEASGDSAWYELTNQHFDGPLEISSENICPVGKPLTGTLIALEKLSLKHVEVGTEKDMYCVFLGGTGLCQGYVADNEERSQNFHYLKRADLRERFHLLRGSGYFSSGNLVIDPNESVVLFRTGDVGYLNEVGMLVIWGREEQLFASQGQEREIERLLNTHHNVSEAKVWQIPASIIHSSPLVACIQWTGEEKDMTRYLSALCEDNGMSPPECFLPWRKAPLSLSGKLNHHAIADLFQDNAPQQAEKATLVLEGPPSEVAIHRIFVHHLGHPIEACESIFESGGDSKTALFISQSCNLPVTTVFQYPTIRGLSRYLMGVSHIRSKRRRSIPVEAEHGTPSLSLHWKHYLGDCIDAPCCQLSDDLVVFASHKGCISCLNSKSGSLKWSIKLNGRIDGPMCAYSHGNQLAVSTSKSLALIDVRSGYVRHNIHGMNFSSRTGPVVDSRGYVWIGTHDAEVISVSSRTGHRRLTAKVSGPVSCPLALLEKESLVLFVAQLNGCITAMLERPGRPLHLEVLWTFKMEEPLFVSPIILQDPYRIVSVVCVGVKGTITCLSLEGVSLWNVSCHNGREMGFYIPPLILSPRQSEGKEGKTGENIVLLSGAGDLWFMRATDGHVLQTKRLCGEGGGQVLQSSPIGRYSGCLKSEEHSIRDNFGIWMSILGGKIAFAPWQLVEDVTNKMLPIPTLKELPSDSYSITSYGNYIYVGCRDDHAYCFKFENV